jgi:3-dehydroquinate dehydratase
MSTISVSIPDEQFAKLKSLANRLGVSPEDIIRMRVDQILTGRDEKFLEAAARALEKNIDLYRRLA